MKRVIKVILPEFLKKITMDSTCLINEIFIVHMVWHKKSNTLLLYQQTLQGFGGERTDASTGWQFLGNGNRTYNPTGRYFLSEDPAGDGYTFGSNNPVMNTDPSGNSSQWMGETFKWVGYI